VIEDVLVHIVGNTATGGPGTQAKVLRCRASAIGLLHPQVMPLGVQRRCQLGQGARQEWGHNRSEGVRRVQYSPVQCWCSKPLGLCISGEGELDVYAKG
jgi:hypothetical protein